MKKVDKAVRELGVRGTPMIYDENFNNIPKNQLLNANIQGSKK